MPSPTFAHSSLDMRCIPSPSISLLPVQHRIVEIVTVNNFDEKSEQLYVGNSLKSRTLLNMP